MTQTTLARSQLAGLIAATVLIAEDPDVLASGLADEQWKDFYDTARAIGVGAGHLHGAAAALVLGGHGAAAAVKGVARMVRTPVGRGVAAAGAIALLVAAVRWGPALRAAWHRGQAARHDILRELGTKTAETLRRLAEAEAM
ncbi:hypothetical protein AB0K00_54185 [Dactylosporangium sp. NPDC049525]|uniref:hypothetical protein n=1 Tax=Dactylosporangium sp. NPDC049525 TaxID=3154730 RepID=UPI003420D903